MTERKVYESGKAPAYLATRIQLAEKKLVPIDDPAATVRTRTGRELDLYDWRRTQHSRFVSADDLKQQSRKRNTKSRSSG